MPSMSQSDIAYELTRYLVEKTGYERTSPLESAVRGMIGELAREIAKKVVDAHPELNSVIEKRVKDTIAVALREDSFLNSTVARAIGEALGQLVRSSDE